MLAISFCIPFICPLPIILFQTDKCLLYFHKDCIFNHSVIYCNGVFAYRSICGVIVIYGAIDRNRFFHLAVILVSKEEMDAVKAYASKVEKGLREEYDGSDKGISIQITEAGHESAKVLHPTSREKVLFYLMEVPFGIQKMSANIEGLVETSTNIGIVSLSEDEFFASSGVRSSVEAARNALSDKIQYLTEFLGGEYEIQGAYPAWEYRKESPLRDKMVEVYETMYGQKPEVVAIHAGLECGLFYKKIDGLDCVSLGPDMKDIHTSEEVLDIASTERVWKYLVKVLEELKD